MLFRCFVMPRVSSATSKPRLHQVAVTALFATLASSSSSSAFNSWTGTTRGPFAVSRGGHYSSSLVPDDRRVGFTTTTSSQSKSTSTRSTMTSSTATDNDTDQATVSTMMSSAEKLEVLRAKMKELELDVYLVPSDDPHLSGK